MSILLVQVLPQGIIFGADRNISFTSTKGDIIEKDGVTLHIYQETHHGQTQRPKVLRWPRGKALIGYAGEALIGGEPVDQWLYDFIGDNLEFSSFEELAENLRVKVETQRIIDEGLSESKRVIIHIGGFEKRGDISVPVIWLVTNAYEYDMDINDYKDIRKEFKKNEELWKYFPEVHPKDIQLMLDQLSSQYEPFGFQHGIDLRTFNMISASMKAAFRFLFTEHPKQHSFPQNLADWEAQVRMSVLAFGAYFQAYKNPGEQYVGGGVDTVSIPWPEQ